MRETSRDLSLFAEKASLLERRISQSVTPNQLREIAQEAAKSYQDLAAQLMSRGRTDKKQLAKLSQKFSQIENKAIMKFYGNDGIGPTVSIL
ncbi:MAG: hypothetical protein AB1489_07145 [Acidobacteriota bacterium]